jgi:hypothetical protein
MRRGREIAGKAVRDASEIEHTAGNNTAETAQPGWGERYYGGGDER